jgi:hypothetical protein
VNEEAKTLFANFIMLIFLIGFGGAFIARFFTWVHSITRCHAYRPDPPMPGASINTNLYRCHRLGVHRLPGYEEMSGGRYCSEHYQEELEIHNTVQTLLRRGRP